MSVFEEIKKCESELQEAITELNAVISELNRKAENLNKLEAFVNFNLEDGRRKDLAMDKINGKKEAINEYLELYNAALARAREQEKRLKEIAAECNNAMNSLCRML